MPSETGDYQLELQYKLWPRLALSDAEETAIKEIRCKQEEIQDLERQIKPLKARKSELENDVAILQWRCRHRNAALQASVIGIIRVCLDCGANCGWM